MCVMEVRNGVVVCDDRDGDVGEVSLSEAVVAKS